MIIERVNKIQIPTPFSSCEIENTSPKSFDSNLYNMLLNSKLNYKRDLCLRLCRQNVTISKCNCTDPRFFSLFNASDCQTKQETECVAQLRENLSFYMKSSCLSEC